MRCAPPEEVISRRQHCTLVQLRRRARQNRESRHSGCSGIHRLLPWGLQPRGTGATSTKYRSKVARRSPSPTRDFNLCEQDTPFRCGGKAADGSPVSDQSGRSVQDQTFTFQPLDERQLMTPRRTKHLRLRSAKRRRLLFTVEDTASSTTGFGQLLLEPRQSLEEVTDATVISHLEERRLFTLVD
jgi:hypothetical protein